MPIFTKNSYYYILKEAKRYYSHRIRVQDYSGNFKYAVISTTQKVDFDYDLKQVLWKGEYFRIDANQEDRV